MGNTNKCFALILTLITAMSCLTLLTAKPANAQSSEPTEYQYLGPVEWIGNGGSVRIVSIQNQSSLNNPVRLVFCVEAYLLHLCYSSVGDIGYSLDGGPIIRVNNFVNQTIAQGADTDVATVWVNLTFPLLTEGQHNVKIYLGYQYQGTQENPSLQRYDVFAYSSVNFLVVNSPSPTQTPSPSSANSNLPLNQSVLIAIGIVAVIVAVAVVSLIYFLRHRRTANFGR